MTTHITKTWFDGEKVVTQEIPESEVYKQEPVAWMVYTQDGQSVYVTDNPTDIQEGQRSLPLYTAPRPWVALTYEEIKSLPSWWPSYEDAPALIELVKDVEAKLREKNA